MLKQKTKTQPSIQTVKTKTRQALKRRRNSVTFIFLLLLFICLAIPGVKAQGDESGGGEFVPGEVVVQLNSALELPAIARQYKLDPTPLDQFGNRPIYRLRLIDNAPVTTRVSELQADSQFRIIYAEPNYLVKPPKGDGILWSDAIPGGDAAAGDYLSQWATQKIQLSVAHNVSRGAGVKIAVLDTGVDFTHPALAGHLVPGYDFVDMDNNPQEAGAVGQGAYGHGTHVTGLLALVAPDAKIMPLRVLDEDGFGNIWVLAEALEYAINPDGDPNTDDGVHVINMSLSTSRRTNLLLNILRKVTGSCSEGGCDFQVKESNTVVVASSGNNGNNIPEYPAAEPFYGMLAVAASDENDVITGFSTRGSWVGMLAPGVRIVSTVPGGGYASWDGTSASAPITAGVVALVRSAFPAENNSTVVSHLLTTAVQVPGPVQRRLNAATALTTQPKPPVTPAVIQFSGGASIEAKYFGYEFARNVHVSVSRYGSDSLPVTVDYATSDKAGAADCAAVSGNASSRCDYTSLAGTLRFEVGEHTKSILIPVNNDTYREGNETLFLTLNNPSGASLGRITVATIVIKEDEKAPSDFEFSAANYSVTENANSPSHSAVVTVKRTGDLRGSASVELKTIGTNSITPCDPNARDVNGNPYPQGLASERCDYIPVVTSLLFGPNESTKDVLIPIVDDAHVEAPETVQIVLTNPLGAGIIGQNLVTLTIMDNDVTGTPNPINSNEFFVRQQYLDFLVREPEPDGLQYYLNILNGCQNTDTECIKYTRGALAANFFRSPEFQTKGSYVMYLYMVTLGQRPSTDAELADPNKNTFERPRYTEFMADVQSITSPDDRNGPDPAKKAALTAAFLQRPEIVAKYGAMSDAQFAQAIQQTAGVTLADQSVFVGKSRAEILRIVAESSEVNARFYRQAFITMQYFGFLRRDPDLSGYVFHNNRYVQIAPLLSPDLTENFIVRGFTESPEYMGRFGN